jgi:orotidine-5'-phosphate decarboxylase
MTAAANASCDVIVALDVPAKERAMHLLDELDNRPPFAKVGLQLFTRYGPGLIEAVAYRGCKVFLDLKLHDIPNTVGHAVESLAHWPVEMLTVHALGGSAMIEAAREARDRTNPGMKIIAVTVLTSLDHERMGEVGMKGEPEKEARRLAKVALNAGADGVVCSPLEVPAMRDRFGDGPLLVVPGIRPAGFDAGDQKRILTPGEAARAGASHLVVGRPIIEAADPSAVYDRILDEIRAPAE